MGVDVAGRARNKAVCVYLIHRHNLGELIAKLDILIWGGHDDIRPLGRVVPRVRHVGGHHLGPPLRARVGRPLDGGQQGEFQLPLCDLPRDAKGGAQFVPHLASKGLWQGLDE